MNQQSESGFTLLEGCVMAVCIGLMAACTLPMAGGARSAANAASDAMQMRTHFVWMEVYKRAHMRALPTAGGHKFVLSTWTSKIFDHTEENLDMYFSPGARERDPDYLSTRALMVKGEDPWPDLTSVTTQDTHYVGRAKKYLRSAMASAQDAWMATDNEGQWTFADGRVNVLFNGGVVRTYSYEDLVQRFDLGAFQYDEPVQTWGPNSPITECQKLAN